MASSGVLSPARYKKLLGDLQKLLEAAESAAAGQRIEGFWRVGERIEREKLDREVGYHNAVMKDLAADSGVGLRNLQRALTFHQTYRKPPQPNGLTWSHYRALLTLESATERTFFEKLTLTEGLSVRELEAAIRQGMDGENEKSPPLERPTDPSYLYQARVYAVVDGDTIDFMVDLGFQVFREQRIRLADVNAPELHEPDGRQARDFVIKQLMHAPTVVVRTYKVDLHGRYVGHVFYSSQKVSVAECFATGKHLNALLVAKGHAKLAG